MEFKITYAWSEISSTYSNKKSTTFILVDADSKGDAEGAFLSSVSDGVEVEILRTIETGALRDSAELQEKITALVKEAGSDRKAASLILSVRGVAPDHSSIVRARQGKGARYVLQCMHDDLAAALEAMK